MTGIDDARHGRAASHAAVKYVFDADVSLQERAQMYMLLTRQCDDRRTIN